MPPLATCPAAFSHRISDRRRLRAALASVLAAFVLAAFAPAAIALDWQVDLTPDGELFPALQLSQPVQGSGNGLLAVRVAGERMPAHVRVRVDTPGLRVPAVIDADTHAAPLRVRPRLDWDLGALRALRAPRRQSLRVTLDGPGIAAQTRVLDVRLHPLDDALYFVREGRERVDLGWAFAGYVDPDDATIDAVLALARAGEPGFDDGHGAAAVRRRVGAIWRALERHGLRYAAGDPALSRGPTIYSQRVRLLADAWRERRANCIDGSVLIASALERIGVPAVIALVPGHAFVGFRAGGAQATTEYLETTLVGSAGFARALDAGRARWRAVAARMDGRHAPDYALIDLATARRYGIRPLLRAEAAAGAGAGAGGTPFD
jgi:hypothetical protein